MRSRKPPARPFPSGRNRPSAQADTGDRPGPVPERERRGTRPLGQDRRPPAAGRREWIFGLHAVTAALDNGRREVLRVLATRDSQRLVADIAKAKGCTVTVTDAAEIARLLPPQAVHQGLAAEAVPLPDLSLDEALDSAGPSALFVLLDQVTDPHNVGAILRSAAAFDAAAVVMTERNAPPVTGIVAKTASGALDRVPVVRVVNLAQTLERLAEEGFIRVGLAEETSDTLASLRLNGRVALVLGNEGDGLRRLTRIHCDRLARLPTLPEFPSLNVSNAAAIALYELRRR